MNALANILETIGQICLRLAKAIRAGMAEYDHQRGKIQRRKIILP